jgi:hypothetical protein
MKLVKQANGKKTIKISRKEWTELGKKAGWMNGIDKQLLSYVSKLLQSPEKLIEKIEQEKIQQETITQAGKAKLLAAILAMFLSIPTSQIYENPAQAVSQAQDRLNTMSLGGTTQVDDNNSPFGRYSPAGLVFDQLDQDK